MSHRHRARDAHRFGVDENDRRRITLRAEAHQFAATKKPFGSNWRRLGLTITRWALCSTVILLTTVACSSSPPQDSSVEPRSLSGPWAFHPGDDVTWAAPGFDDSGWVRLQVPGSWRRQGFDGLTGLAWYRLRVPAIWPADEALGLTLGKIDSAYALYVGGQQLGGVGALPPNPRMEYDRHRTYSIPSDAREPDGSVVLALRVWRHPEKISSAAGPVEGPFKIGPLARVIERQQRAEAGQMTLVLLFLVVALHHFALRLRLGSGADYMWFGVMALLAATYGFLRTQWKYLVLDDFLVLKKIEHLVLWLVPPAILQFLWVFFGEPRPRWLRYAQIALLAGAVTVVVVPGLLVALAMLPVLQLLVVPLLAVCLALVARRIRAGDREAILVGFGMAVLGVTIVHDALVDRNYIVNPRVAVFGFAFLVVGMSVTLGDRFHRALRERDTLTRELEARVDARTRELSAAYQQMKELALRDGLTQLLNRGAIRERAASELARARRQQTPFAIAVIDIDHFKIVNDTHGHAAGDQVLVQVARRLAEAVRASDHVGRWGGEEFMVLMPDTRCRDAAAAGERLRALLAAGPMAIADDVAQTVTISLGLVAVDGGSSESLDLDALIGRADEALYRAKADGRNAVRMAGGAAS
jgi:diguanylate cyclase (GGDEF)-like protein